MTGSEYPSGRAMMSCIKRALRFGSAAGFLAVALALAGCGTAGTPSDIPWNVPQPWEGAPTLPGL